MRRDSSSTTHGIYNIILWLLTDLYLLFSENDEIRVFFEISSRCLRGSVVYICNDTHAQYKLSILNEWEIGSFSYIW